MAIPAGAHSEELAARVKVPYRPHGFFHEIWSNRWIYGMALPGVLFLFMFSYIPLTGIVIAFKDFNVYDGIFNSPWNNFRNFEFFFTSPDAWIIMWNTIYLNFLFILFGTLFQIGLAVMINELAHKSFKKAVQSIIFFPYFLSWVVIGELVYSMLSRDIGSVNRLLGWLGIAPVDWYTHPEYWRTVLTVVYVWKWTGYGSVIYLAALAGIDPTYYEAAKVDGASRVQQVWYVTLPQLVPTIVLLTLLAVGRIFYGDFGMIFGIVKDNGMLMPTTDIIDTYVYRSMRVMNEFGLPTAIGLVQSIVGFALVLVCNYYAKRIGDGTRLF
jgi:putative aldouronate transport system permease protein